MTKQRFLTVMIPIFLLAGPECKPTTETERQAEVALFVSQFETVAYTHSDLLSNFDMGELGQKDMHAVPVPPLALRLPFVVLAAGLRALGPTALQTLGQSYTAFALGAHDFKPPEGLGMFTSRDCYIGVASGNLRPDVTKVFNSVKTEFISGTAVWAWSIPPSEGYPREMNFYAAQIGSSYLLLTNDQQMFKDTASLLLSASAAPDEIPGWETFSTHNYWVYRSLNGIKTAKLADPKGITSDARVLTFFANIDKKRATVQVHVEAKAADTMPNGLPASKWIQYHRAGPGTWEATIPLVQEPSAISALYQIFGYFGFGVVL